MINSSWIPISQFPSDQPRPSIGAIFATPETSWSGSPRGNYSLYSCTIDARWAYTRAILDASSGQPIVFDANPDPDDALLDSTYAIGQQAATAPPSVKIEEGWAAAMNPRWVDSITSLVPGNSTVLDMVGQICFDRYTLLNKTMAGSSFPDGLSHYIMAPSLRSSGSDATPL